MSYTISLPCGCTAYVSCWPDTGVAHTRVIEFRAAQCQVRTHERGSRVYLWELLPKRVEGTRQFGAGRQSAELTIPEHG